MTWWKVALGVSLGTDLLLSGLLGVAMQCFSFDFGACAGIDAVLSLVRVPLIVAVLVLGAWWGAPAPEPAEGQKDETEREMANLLTGDESEDADAALLSDNAPAVARRWLSPEWAKRAALGSLFALSAGSQLVLGVKSASAPLTVNREAVQALLCLLIVSLNAQLYAGRAVLNLLTQPETRLVPRAHHHPLVLRTDVGWARCDRCHRRIAVGKCYSCAPCDWVSERGGLP